VAEGRRATRCVILTLVIEAAADARPADWLTRSAGMFGTVHSMVPDVFEAYARVFHPAMLCEREVRWSEVASANGRTMHGAAEWGSLVGSWQLGGQAGLWDSEPDTGPMPERLALRLAGVLGRHTSTPQRCWFGVWDGWGSPSVLMLFPEGTPADERARISEERQQEADRCESFFRAAPTFEMPSRRMHLLEGPLEEMASLFDRAGHPPSIWWPDDRAWCIGGDVDLMTTYLGGTTTAVEAVVSNPELEALAITAGQDVTWEADTVNPPVGPPPF
jgi:hypothetical protein